VTVAVLLFTAACPSIGPEDPCIDAFITVWDGYRWGEPNAGIQNLVTLELGDSTRFRAHAVCHDPQGLTDLTGYDSLVTWTLTSNPGTVRASPPDVARGLVSPWYVGIAAGEASLRASMEGVKPNPLQDIAYVRVLDPAEIPRSDPGDS
jgi:hypothetical protein